MCGDTAAAILHEDGDVSFIVAFAAQRHLAIGLSELEGVADETTDHPQQLVVIGLEGQLAVAQPAVQGQAVQLCGRCMQFDVFGDDLASREGFDIEGRCGGVDLSHSQHAIRKFESGYGHCLI